MEWMINSTKKKAPKIDKSTIDKLERMTKMIQNPYKKCSCENDEDVSEERSSIRES